MEPLYRQQTGEWEKFYVCPQCRFDSLTDTDMKCPCCDKLLPQYEEE